MFLPPPCQQSDAHIWKVDLSDTRWDRFVSVLSADEDAKALRFHHARSQCFYRRCRLALRLLLSAYTHQSGASLAFDYDMFGKPELPDRAWRFNLSHSQDKALIAISRHQVGVDLEFAGSVTDIDAVADLVCHPGEREALAALPMHERSAWFDRLWVQKESYSKALGIGLQCELPAICFSELAPSIARVWDAQAGDMAQYYVHFMQPFPGCAASLCLPIATERIALLRIGPEQFEPAIE